VTPLLYSFRRCPYAIRARLAIKISGVEVEMREVDLRNKPQAMLDCSPKGTVPVLRLADGKVIDESLDIMRWALAIHDPQTWLADFSAEAHALIAQNDGSFKRDLDRYKYADRYPEHPAEYYRERAEDFLLELDSRLAKRAYLTGNRLGFADMAILPFVRQCAYVNKNWFYASHYTQLIQWLDGLLQSPLFINVMKK
jgi:glutathione S-transferase